MASLALGRVAALGLVLSWDHNGVGITRWLLVVDGLERDVTLAVREVGPTVPAYGDEPCDGCREWRVDVPDLTRNQRITAKACIEDVCSPESAPRRPTPPDSVAIR